MNIITANCAMFGHLRYGHYELTLDDNKLKEFKSLSIEDQHDWIRENGDLMLDDYSLDETEIIEIIIDETKREKK